MFNNFIKPGLEDLCGGTPLDNARLIEKIFQGKEDPRSDAVVLNAAFAAVLGEKAQDVREGVVLAREAMASGAVLAMLDDLRNASEVKLEETI